MTVSVRGLSGFLAAGLLALGCGGGGGGTGPDANAVASVVVSPSTGSLNAVGATTSFTAQARNSAGAALTGKTFTWTSEATGVATVNATSGVATAVANGTATIRATATGTSVSGTATVSVQQVVANITVTPPTGNAFVGGAVQFQASATDAGGAPVVSPNVTWSSSNTAVATISNLGLATAVGPGTSTITVSAGTPSATAVMNAQYRPLNIGQDTSMSGNVTFNQVTIAAGRTVTVTGPLTITAQGRVNIAGTIMGSCVPVSILGDTAVTVTGTVANGCAAGTAADLTIRANGELNVDGATITSSGDISLGNSPDHTEASFPFAARRSSAAIAAATQGVRTGRIANSTIRQFGTNGTGTGPNPAAGGGSGNPGQPGANGRNMKMIIDGNLTISGATTIWGQEGGKGGDGTAPATTNNLAVTGGAGGRGGKISIFTTGKLTFDGAGNIVRGGRGGNGGNATSQTLTNALSGATGPTATANSGDGGEPGLVDIRASNGIHVATAGALQIEVIGGNGGAATATAANGADATAGQAAQGGGAAFASGGKGGNTPKDTLKSGGGVTGSPPTLVDRGGDGGNATATAGNGGKGLKPNKNAATGGRPTANGGNGGDAELQFPAGVNVGTGGNAGGATMLNGNGGDGWDGCTAGQEEPGGNGGDGGSIGTLVRGLGGSGATTGNASVLTFTNVGNGGDGGGGTVAGTGGQAGAGPVAPSMAAVAGDVQNPPTFTAGQTGATCLAVVPNAPPSAHFYMEIANWPASGQGFISPGTYTRNLFPLPNATVATGQVFISTIANNFTTYYFRPGPPRIGQPGSSTTGWDLNLASVKEGSVFINVEFFSICFLEENPVPSLANQIVIEQRDNFGVTQQTDFISGPGGPILDGRAGCREYTRHLNATHVRWYRTGIGTTEVDWVGFKRKLTP